MKNYIKMHHERSKLGERIYWWIFRGIMVYAIIDCIIKVATGAPDMNETSNFQQILQSLANLVGMFAWEIMISTSKKSWMHYIPSYVQNITLLGFFLGSFGGAYMNLYYTFPPYDIVLHAFGGAEACFVGYEILTAIQKRDKKTAPIGLVILGACGISFMFGVGWELFEFTFDQVAGGDSQHWSMELAKIAAEKYNCGMPNVIPALNDMRYALIDTMEDTIANVVGAVAMLIALAIKPYHHKGKNDINKLIEEGK